jgi:hypothetical protein
MGTWDREYYGSGMVIGRRLTTTRYDGGKIKAGGVWAAAGATSIIFSAMRDRELELMTDVHCSGVDVQVGEANSYEAINRRYDYGRTMVDDARGEVRFYNSADARDVTVVSGRLRLGRDWETGPTQNFHFANLTIDDRSMLLDTGWNDGGVQVHNGTLRVDGNITVLNGRLRFDCGRGTAGADLATGGLIAQQIIIDNSVNNRSWVDIANGSATPATVNQKFVVTGGRFPNTGNTIYFEHDGSATLTNVVLAEGSIYLPKKGGSGGDLYSSVTLDGNATISRNTSWQDPRVVNVRPADPNVPVTLNAGIIGTGDSSIYGEGWNLYVTGTVANGATLNSVRGHVQLLQGAVLEPNAVINALGTTQGADYRGEVRVRSGSDGDANKFITAGTINLAGGHWDWDTGSLRVMVNDAPTVPGTPPQSPSRAASSSRTSAPPTEPRSASSAGTTPACWPT